MDSRELKAKKVVMLLAGIDKGPSKKKVDNQEMGFSFVKYIINKTASIVHLFPSFSYALLFSADNL